MAYTHTHMLGGLVMTPGGLCPLTFGGCVSDERLQGLLTSDLSLFTSWMERDDRKDRRGRRSKSIVFLHLE